MENIFKEKQEQKTLLIYIFALIIFTGMGINLSGKKDTHTFDWAAGFYMVAGYFTASLALFFVSYVLGEDYPESSVFALISYIFVFLVSILFYDLFVVRLNHQNLSFNFKSPHISAYGFLFPMMLGSMFISEFFTEFIPTTGKFFQRYYEILEKSMGVLFDDPVTMVFSVSIFAPLLEEIVFRGIIQRGMMNKGVKPVKAIVISSLIFGIIHANPWQLVGAFILGLMLGYAYYKTGSLLIAILLHAFNNTLVTLLMMKSNTETFTEFYQTSEWIILLMGIALVGVFGYLFNKRKANLKVENGNIGRNA